MAESKQHAEQYQETEAGNDAATARHGTDAHAGGRCQDSDTKPLGHAAGVKRGPGCCTPLAGGPQMIFKHLQKYLGMAVTLVIAVLAFRVVASRFRTT